MIKSQIKLLWKRREFILTFFIMTVISLGSFLFNCFRQNGFDVMQALSADKLFIGRSYNNELFILLQFLLPLLAVIPFSDSYLLEKQLNILPCLLTRTSATRYLFAKMAAVSLSAAAVVFVPFLLNFILGLIAFPAESINYSFHALASVDSTYRSSYAENILFPELFFKNPYLYNFVFLLLLTAFCALLAVITFQVSFTFTRNKILLLALPFIGNNFLIIVGAFGLGLNPSPFSYLFSFDDPPGKFAPYLPFLFAAMLAAVIFLTPRCLNRLKSIEKG